MPLQQSSRPKAHEGLRFCRANLRGPNSFSLIELLLAMAILSILVFVLMSMLGQLTAAWQFDQARNERRNIAQNVLDRMTRDISQAALPLAKSDTNSLDFIINPGTSWVGSQYQYPESIFFQAPVATDGGTNGNLAVVGYFVQWVNGTPGTPTLTRLLINPSSPSGTGTDYHVYSGMSNWINNSLIANANYGAATAPNYAGLFAENVIGLWVQALDPTTTNAISQTGSGLSAGSFDSRYPYFYTNYDLSPVGSGFIMTNTASALPSAVQVAIAVVDSRTARQITAIPSHYVNTGNLWNDVQTFYNGLPANIRKGTEIQTTIIPLANGPR